MHERALMRPRRRDRAARPVAARAPITRIDVRLGALSHFTPDHFREHFVDASLGTLAEGAAVHAELDADVHAPRATGSLESVEVEA